MLSAESSRAQSVGVEIPAVEGNIVSSMMQLQDLEPPFPSPVSDNESDEDTADIPLSIQGSVLLDGFGGRAPSADAECCV